MKIPSYCRRNRIFYGLRPPFSPYETPASTEGYILRRNLFSEDDKRKYRDEHYDLDLKNAYELGVRLVEKCREG